MSRKYVLRGRKVIEVEDLITWAREFEHSNRVVSRTFITPEVYVSTVFLGIDHGWNSPEPVLFETMVFGPQIESSYEIKGRRESFTYRVSFDEFSRRYCTIDQAEAGHAEIVHEVKRYITKVELDVGATLAQIISKAKS